MIEMPPIIRTRRGSRSPWRSLSSGFRAKKLNSMKAVALVGPRTLKRELAKKGAVRAAMALLITP